MNHFTTLINKILFKIKKFFGIIEFRKSQVTSLEKNLLDILEIHFFLISIFDFTYTKSNNLFLSISNIYF